MSIVLKANDVVVAEVENPTLWNAVFAAINAGSSGLPSSLTQALQAPPAAIGSIGLSYAADTASNTPALEPIDKFAKELGLDKATVEGACDPSTSDPFITLDRHCWESMKSTLPARGVNAITPIVLASTILALWNRHAGFGAVTQLLAQNTLAQIGAKDSNPTRGLDGCDWLQRKQGGAVTVNPARVSRAITIATCFCSRDWSGWKNLP
jgi:hypothetical protein